jgi:hypothetical protein
LVGVCNNEAESTKDTSRHQGIIGGCAG